jgi:hypothetical protein
LVEAGDTLGTPLGTAVGKTGIGANQDEMPFRPSWDQAKCLAAGTDANGGNDTGKWYDAASNLCLNGYPFPVTFDFSSQNIAVPAGGKVIWTVWYDTTNSGRFPLGALPCRTDNGGDPGCGYDSLNVADWTFTNAPNNDAYAGTDVDPAAQWIDRGTGLAPEAGNTGLRPDAQIITG